MKKTKETKKEKKGFFAGLFDRLDRSMEKKAKGSKCSCGCKCSKDEE